MSADKKQEEPLDIEQLLAQQKTIQLYPKGMSMHPLFCPGRDQAILAPVDPKKLHWGDVALFRREGSILVLHRICKKKDGQFYFVGDNQREVEGPVAPAQIRGKLIGFVRKGREHSTGYVPYVLYSTLWLLLLPMRPLCWRLLSVCRKLVSAVKK